MADVVVLQSVVVIEDVDGAHRGVDVVDAVVREVADPKVVHGSLSSPTGILVSSLQRARR